MKNLATTGAVCAICLLTICAAATLTSGCAKESGSPFSRSRVDLKKLTPFAADATPQVSNVPPPPAVDPQAPDRFLVRFKTTKGDFVAEVNREWSPRGVDRFHNMVKVGYFNDIAIFRAVPNFMFQFGIHGNPAVNKDWAEARFKDDTPVGVSNLPGTLCFAKTGQPNSRSVQMFVNLGQNAPLDIQGFTPFAKVIEGMDVVRAINTEYGENPSSEDVQGKLKREGNDYVLKRFPRIDLIRSVELIQPTG
ncbi:peptidylprolyl isomerase [Mariniblastus fucicola]|uniref:peptidylprolyl isomerase n=1 Tax=Mariniblastus fucicola TaxID=980251 RepID=A0A5B9PIS7_9BACT|nr:peptidylprolyl isomerase [Mariniblastus fucicola]QEG22523.1 Peptidyl-prolyl cis-trans isomerase B [Mariniblastus fucicola]